MNKKDIEILNENGRNINTLLHNQIRNFNGGGNVVLISYTVKGYEIVIEYLNHNRELQVFTYNYFNDVLKTLHKKENV